MPSLFFLVSFRASSFRTFRLIFPVDVFGISLTTRIKGTLYELNRCWQKDVSRRSTIACSSVSSDKTTTAWTTCPKSSSITPKTPASITSGCEYNTFSTSLVKTFSPPTMMMSLRRSMIVIYPFECFTARSPVINQPSAVKLFLVASSLFQ